jgi:DNA-binding transcriptional regulator LsrR (DeoR family)
MKGGGIVSPKSYQTTSWYDARVEIRPSLIQGGGMFARRPIQAGEIVAIVGGTVMTECAESFNHLRQLFYHPVLQVVYNYHQTQTMPRCFCRQAGLFFKGRSSFERA